MKVLTCPAARRRLQAYHDGELAISEQIDVGAHLEWCDGCAELLGELQSVRGLLRMRAPRSASLTAEEGISLQAGVIARLRAERTESWSARAVALFDDMHFVYAGLGAGVSTVACIMIMLSMMRFATSSEHSPGSNTNPVVIDARMNLLPRALNQTIMLAPTGLRPEETFFTISGIVTREGRVTNLEFYSGDGDRPREGSDEAKAAQEFMGAVSQARFEPARVAGLPVAVNMVWMIAHTTVHATATLTPLAGPGTPAVRRRRVIELPLEPEPARPAPASTAA
jgi:hypothetical protein